MKEKLKQAFSERKKRYITDDGLVKAAVLVPIYLKNGQCHILFTKRTETVKVHKGQISFPGGAYEEVDRTLVNTALRESVEEIHLDKGMVEVLGELDDATTVTSNYVISPFVGVIPWPYDFALDKREVEEIIEVPITALLDKNAVQEVRKSINGTEATLYYYHYQGRIIWGATAAILRQFLDIFTEVNESGESD